MRNDAINIASRKVGTSLHSLSKRYQRLGKAMIITIPEEFKGRERMFGQAILSSFKLWTIYQPSEIKGVMRVPSMKVLSGIKTEVVHRENGIVFKLDPMKVMYSKGNKNERVRMRKLVRKEETVLDMYAGIGYFSIPVSFSASKVFACEINPDSFHYLLINKRLNKTQNLIPMFGDSSQLNMRGFADRIIMGHFESLDHINSAVSYLKKRGNIHLHRLIKRGEELRTIKQLENLPYSGFVSAHKVKSYSPSTEHYVYDISVQKE